MKPMKVVSLLLCLCLFISCAAGTNPMKNTPNDKKETAGFFLGLWHGIILPVTFVISLFTSDVNVYETHNNGGWYNFGFVLGLAIIFGGSGGGAGTRMRRR
ncbi:MAG: hypothetical protein JXD23_12515 [Spirochaetales bacterium]|nr:hypothetical protein [Spirochaetales bacterium]